MSIPTSTSLKALQQARARLDEQLAATPEDSKLLLMRGRTDERLGNHEEAAGFYQRAAKVQRQVGDRAGEANAWLEAAQAFARAGHNAKARTFFQRAVAGFELVGDSASTVAARLAFARFHLSVRSPSDARQQLESTLEHLESTSSWEQLGWVLDQLATVHQAEGDPEAALERTRVAVECAAKAKDRPNFGRRLSTMATLHFQAARWGKARSYQDKAMPYLKEGVDREALLNGYFLLADAARELGQPARRLVALEDAMVVADGGGSGAERGTVRLRLADVLADAEDFERALQVAEAAVDLLHRAGDPHASGPANALLGRIAARSGDTAGAIRALERARDLYRMVGDQAGATVVEEWLASLAQGTWSP